MADDFVHIVEPLRAMAVDLRDLIHDPANARTHDRRNLDAIKASLRAYGQRTPIVVQVTPDGRRIIRKGNGTTQAARELAESGDPRWWMIAAVEVREDNLSATGYAIADNRTAELAAWDDEVLAKLLDEIAREDEEVLASTGFSDEEIGSLLEELACEDSADSDDDREALTVDSLDRAAELQEKWDTKPGQVWEAGEHRVMCGDCRNPADVRFLFGGRQAQIAFTSPPYASQRKYDGDAGFEPIHPDNFSAWFDAVQQNVRMHLADDGSWFVNIKEHSHDGQRSLYVMDLVLEHVRAWSWRYVDQFNWVHNGLPGTWPNRFKNQFEPVFHFSISKQIKFRPDNVRHASADAFEYAGALQQASTGNPISNLGKDLVRMESTALPGNCLTPGKNNESWSHEAMFPVRLPSFFIKAFSDDGDLVYDPFCGSGTTVVAAHRLNRVGLGMELSPKYMAVILERLEAEGLSPSLVDCREG